MPARDPRPATLAGRRVLVLGAAGGIRASLAAARAAGAYLVVADAHPAAGALAEGDEAYVTAIDDATAVTALARRTRADGILATTDHAVFAAAEAAVRCGVPGIPPAAAWRVTRKAAMRECWAGAGLPQPDTAVVDAAGALEAAVARLRWPLVLKPADTPGGGSRGVSMARDDRELRAAWQFAREAARGGRVLVEQCLDARSEHSVELLLHDGRAHVLAIGDKVKTPPPYRVDLAVCYPTALDATSRAAVGALAAACAEALGIAHGLLHVEIGITPDGPALFEAGARCGGGATAAPIVPWVTGIDEFAEACRLACGLAPERVVASTTRGACYRFITPRRGRALDHARVQALAAEAGILEASLWGADPDAAADVAAEAVRSGSDRIGAIVAGAATRAEAIGRADAALSSLDGGDATARSAPA